MIGRAMQQMRLHLNANSSLGVDKNLNVNKKRERQPKRQSFSHEFSHGMNTSHTASFAGGRGRPSPGKPHR
jgi:hypothetical protein